MGRDLMPLVIEKLASESHRQRLSQEAKTWSQWKKNTLMNMTVLMPRRSCLVLNRLQETNRQWFDRMQSEARLASDFANKVIAGPSIPDAMTACQECANRRFEMMAEDGKRLFADGQKLVEAGTHRLSNGFSVKGRDVSAQAIQHQG